MVHTQFNQLNKILFVMKKILLVITIIAIALTSCSRYSSPYPDGHPCERVHRPNIFNH